MGRIEADIEFKSWLFEFRPCSGQGQFTLHKYLIYLYLYLYLTIKTLHDKMDILSAKSMLRGGGVERHV